MDPKQQLEQLAMQLGVTKQDVKDLTESFSNAGDTLRQFGQSIFDTVTKFTDDGIK